MIQFLREEKMVISNLPTSQAVVRIRMKTNMKKKKKHLLKSCRALCFVSEEFKV